MQYDELNKKIKESSERYHPVYDDRAWDKMRAMLDKEMPHGQKKKRKYAFFFLPAFLLVGGISFYLFFNHYNIAVTRIADRQQTKNADLLVSPNTDAAGNKLNTASAVNPQTLPEFISPIKDQGLLPGIKENKNVSLQKNKGYKEVYKQQFAMDVQSSRPDIGEEDNPEEIGNMSISIQTGTVNNIADAELKKNDKIITPALPAKDKNLNEPVQKRKHNSLTKSLEFSISAGADVSAADLKEPGKITGSFGAGIGFNMHKRLKIKTGFYYSRKVYEAEASSYHPPENFWNNYPALEEVYANCKVYQLPLTINYTFHQSGKFFCFAGAGFNSYLMKKEVYDYSTKDAALQSQYKSITIENRNQHYFAAVRLTGGVERKLGNKFFLNAAPYIDIPVGGIGYGKVKLKSAGVLLTVGMRPFEK